MEYETHSWMNPYYNPDTSEYDPGVNQDLPYNETGLQFVDGPEFFFKSMVFLLVTCSVVCGCCRGAHMDYTIRSRRNRESSPRGFQYSPTSNGSWNFNG